MLALPLTYAVARSRAALGWSRWGYVVAAFAILLALSQQRKAIELLETAFKDRSDVLAFLIQALVLPYATWLVLLAMGVLALADRREASADVVTPRSP